MKQYWVYIMASPSGTLYIGMTSKLEQRVWQHKNKTFKGFTSQYNVTRLVYYEDFADVYDAIAREKQVKGWLRAKKEALIRSINPKWRGLSEDWHDSRERRE